ncbi:2-amino-4-hydroxy-6-hydroxymethyldihydropteridine pyrophosphokinase [Candidatus Liberibacter solanacearum CLso-ZC1]|uniref:2-amino-4-hydroxy-6-hydroxymethyldihydropteridine pyrophosphokinase n=1 Tax=Liberibacter solanacearum (strain CLso-ZC1) TaxID=658172 RepID=E4UBB9_LIBSC|nr:2-amino-4-hydroxy-6-hydroxymethyldihydropteridine diphosphokinase [Candidatus Liberibacter solanacearum]ADR52598.1 2-amino-4-hydroxy-6-hydroxymethyldihydropteridine pyrophosphokinase [Candidatus Liberibacter solanacearum CLso-ZC1]
MWKPESNINIKINPDDFIAIGIGSNIGDKKKYISHALNLIHQHNNCEIIAVSRLYKTVPWGNIDQDFFLNAVALVRTKISPDSLLDILLSIENNLKRQRNEKWGARTIDLDILLAGKYSSSTERLTIPHPYIVQRAFVLVPLADVAPHMVIHGFSVIDWIKKIDVSGVQVINEGYYWWCDL